MNELFGTPKDEEQKFGHHRTQSDLASTSTRFTFQPLLDFRKDLGLTKGGTTKITIGSSSTIHLIAPSQEDVRFKRKGTSAGSKRLQQIASMQRLAAPKLDKWPTSLYME